MEDLDMFADIINDEVGDEMPDTVEVGDRAQIEKMGWALKFAMAELADMEMRYSANLDALFDMHEQRTLPIQTRITQLTKLLTGWHQANLETAEDAGKSLPKSIKLDALTLTSRAAGPKVTIADNDEVVGWFEANDHADAVTVKKSVTVTAVKDILKAEGTAIPGVDIAPAERTYSVKDA